MGLYIDSIIYHGFRSFTMTERLLTQPRTVVFYLSLLFFPHPARLNLDHHFPVSTSLWEPLSMLGAFIFLEPISNSDKPLAGAGYVSGQAPVEEEYLEGISLDGQRRQLRNPLGPKGMRQAQPLQLRWAGGYIAKGYASASPSCWCGYGARTKGLSEFEIGSSISFGARVSRSQERRGA